jgi:hypothetical protein
LDKYEYKLRAEEIRELVKEKRYQEALPIVENIDWNRVRGASMLTIASEVYKANGKFEQSREILLLAYERHPGKRSIIFSLCELCLKMGDFIAAIKYYKEFVKVATRDSRRYILQYKIYESQDVSLEERIAVLEEYKRHDYRERWAYELAYLYHRQGLPTKCVEECDELIVWFGEGKYVKKAMELKMLHQPLTLVQQEKYKRITQNNQSGVVSSQTDELDIKVKTMDMSKYNTINLQQELAECMQEFMRVTEDAEEENRKPLYKEETETFFEPKEEQPKQEEQTLDTGMKEIRVEEEENAKVLYKSDELKQELDVETDEVTINEEENRSFADEKTEVIDANIENLLHQEYDGQISLVVAENKMEQQQLDVQITGQLSIKDILLEWERMKKKNEEKRKEDVRQRVMEQTCDMFSEFDAATKAEIQADLKRLADGITSAEYVKEMEEEEATTTNEILEEEQGIALEANLDAIEVTESMDHIEEGIEAELQEEITKEEIAETTTEETLEEVTAEEAEVAIEEEIAETIAEETITKEEIAETITEEAEVAEETVKTILESETIKELEEMEAIEDGNMFDEEEVMEDASEERMEQPARNTKETCSDITKAFISERDTQNFQKEVQKELKKQEKQEKKRQLSASERKLFGPFVQTKEAKRQIIHMIDQISLTSYTGNVIITGEIDKRTFDLAKCVVKQLQAIDNSFSGKVAKISAGVLREKGFEKTVDRLVNGAIIVEQAGMFNKDDINELRKALQREEVKVLMILIDHDRAINRLLTRNECIINEFNARIDITELDNDSLVAYGIEYALEKEYTIDEMGTLALYSRIADLQTCIHAVDTKEVEEIVNKAIDSANRKIPKHFFQVLFNSRYDEEDRIILREKNFLSY